MVALGWHFLAKLPELAILDHGIYHLGQIVRRCHPIVSTASACPAIVGLPQMVFQRTSVRIGTDAQTFELPNVLFVSPKFVTAQRLLQEQQLVEDYNMLPVP
jgi:hypothetical protein